MISQPTSLRQFSPRLEAIRGIAALMVALSHSMGAVLLTTPVDHWLKQASNILGNGAAGVSIFFVLSGHVLGLSLGGGNMHPIRYWPIFMLRRVLRIYPAMLVCLTACIAYLAWLYEPSQFSAASSDYYEYWHYKVDWEKYYKNILLIDNAINPVTWTLQVEILGAVALPFFYVIKITHPVASRFLLGAWLLYFFMIPNMYAYARTGFLYMFLVGLYVSDLSRWLCLRLSPSTLGLFALISWFGCCIGNQILPETKPAGWVMESVFAWMLLASIYAFPNQRRIPVLDRREVRFLGKISYSFYLWHFPVLYIVGTEMFRLISTEALLAHPIFSQWVLFGVTSSLALIIASLSYKYVEHPCKGLSRRKMAFMENSPDSVQPINDESRIQEGRL